ncbi:MAG: FAD:protein FMN transferase [Flavobacteriaceae bacterium]
MKPFLLIFSALILVSCTNTVKNTKLSGSVFGTSYHITYLSPINYQKAFDSLFGVINASMSTYIPTSKISRINNNETVEIDNHFLTVFNTSKTIYQATGGAFDPTIGVVVNAWDFGPEGKIQSLDSLKIDSLMAYVGFNKVSATNNIITKQPGTFIDFNAIAKGYAVDVIGEFLETQNIADYLVEIGGEIRAKGLNKEKESAWKIGIEQPHFNGEQSILKAISIQNEAMATSGTYRKFKVDGNGNRYSHIIDTKTGYPSKTNLLSISVIAKDCMTADAYATAFKTMGIENVSGFLKTRPELKAFLIFENENGAFETLSLNGFPDE